MTQLKITDMPGHEPRRGREDRDGRGRGRGDGRGRGGRGGRGRGGRGGRGGFNSTRRLQLRDCAEETMNVLPTILSQIPKFDATASTQYDLKDLLALDPGDCPGITLPADDPEAGKKGTRIRVYDQDTFDTALQLQKDATVSAVLPVDATSGTDDKPSAPASDSLATAMDVDNKDSAPTSTALSSKPLVKPVAVLNLASEKHPGGGWLNGSLAQEEALCYRSSLFLSLHSSYYPLPSLSAIYTPSVLLIRTSMTAGHNLLHLWDPIPSLPVTSVITVAGLRHPDVTKDGKFAEDKDRETTKDKIRLSLRVAAREGHRKVVLGALGCGVFGNPPEEVARCFLEVLRETEFEGGWWEDVAFAVLDNAKGEDGGKDGKGNFGMFYRVLNGEMV